MNKEEQIKKEQLEANEIFNQIFITQSEYKYRTTGVTKEKRDEAVGMMMQMTSARLMDFASLVAQKLHNEEAGQQPEDFIRIAIYTMKKLGWSPTLMNKAAKDAVDILDSKLQELDEEPDTKE